MQTRKRITHPYSVGALALVVLLASTTFAQSDPHLGTWKLNLSKSSFEPGPPPKSDTRVNEPWETDGYTQIVTVVQADGAHTAARLSVHYDGKDYKVTGWPDADTIAVTRVDANRLDFTLKMKGKVVQTGNILLTDNGKTRTITTMGTNAKGQKMHTVAVYDRQ
jgi:hypothetical protein